MLIFNKRKLWYLTKFAKFQYRVGRGDALQEMVFGKVKAVLSAIWTMGTGEIVVQGWFGVSLLEILPWWAILIAFPIIATIFDYFLGWLDEKKINLMQIQSEITLRRKLHPWQTEQMNRIKNIEKKIAPETYKEEHKTYIQDGKRQRKLMIDNDKDIN